jgi:hypothetical protein
MLQNRLCSAAALVAMVFLPSSVSASLIGAGTRAAAPPEAGLLQEARRQRICRPQGLPPRVRLSYAERST